MQMVVASDPFIRLVSWELCICIHHTSANASSFILAELQPVPQGPVLGFCVSCLGLLFSSIFFFSIHFSFLSLSFFFPFSFLFLPFSSFSPSFSLSIFLPFCPSFSSFPPPLLLFFFSRSADRHRLVPNEVPVEDIVYFFSPLRYRHLGTASRASRAYCRGFWAPILVPLFCHCFRRLGGFGGPSWGAYGGLMGSFIISFILYGGGPVC